MSMSCEPTVPVAWKYTTPVAGAVQRYPTDARSAPGRAVDARTLVAMP